MTNPQKAKGSAFERDVVGFLRENGHPFAERKLAGGAEDRGDIGGIPGVVLELKNQARIDLSTFVDEAALEARNVGVEVFAAVIKRKGKPVAQAYAVMPLSVFSELIK